MSLNNLKVEVLQHTPEPEKTAALAAKLCYSDSNIAKLAEKVTVSEQAEFIAKIAEMGHHSVFEHVSFTFGIEGVSRALTHQLVRHRVASFSQKSQRYVKASAEFPHIVPPSIANDGRSAVLFDAAMKQAGEAYAKLVEAGIPAEDARYVLPNAAETKIIVTMNARELLHFFSLRSCNRAQWEIRELSDAMLAHCCRIAPNIFKKAGPSCVGGACGEGKFSCGMAADVRKRVANLKLNTKDGEN